MFSKSKEEPVMAKTPNGNSAKPQRASSSAPSIIGANVRIKGDIATAGEIQLDGTVVGDINAAAITMGEEGCLEGTIVAEKVVIRGQVKGSIRGKNVVMERTARVAGDVYHATLSIEAGAIIEGTFSHTEDPLAKGAELTRPAAVTAAPKSKPKPAAVVAEASATAQKA